MPLNKTRIKTNILRPKIFWLLRGALLGPNNLKQSGISTVLWQESPKFMTLFVLVSVWSQESYFGKRNYEILKNWKKTILTVSTSKGPPFGKKIEKIKLFVSFPKNHTISTWIWILHVLSFLLRYMMSILLNSFKFSLFLAMKFPSITTFILWPLVAKIVIIGDYFRYLWTAKHQNIYLRSSFGHLEVFWQL